MMMLNVFSKPLHISEAFQWVLIIGVFVPIALTFHWIKVPKREKAEAEMGKPAADSPAELQKKMKNRLLLMLAIGSIIGLCAPLWLPLTGTTLGARGDFVVGLFTVGIVATIFGLRLRKINT